MTYIAIETDKSICAVARVAIPYGVGAGRGQETEGCRGRR